MSGLRCFVAIEFPPAMRQELWNAGESVRELDPEWQGDKWVTPDRIHLTLKFLGDVDAASLEGISEALGAVASGGSPFELRTRGLTAIPGARRCRMVWAVFDDTGDRCRALAQAVDEAVVAFGIEAEQRLFSAHATLCRARRPKRIDRKALADAGGLFGRPEDSMSVASFSLLSSRLTPDGPEYTRIGAWELGG